MMMTRALEEMPVQLGGWIMNKGISRRKSKTDPGFELYKLFKIFTIKFIIFLKL